MKKILIICIILSAGYVVYTMGGPTTYTVMQDTVASITPQDDIDPVLANVKAHVEELIRLKEKQIKNEQIELEALAEYRRLHDIASSSAQEYIDMLDTAELYGNGVIDIYFATAKKRGLIPE